MRKEYHKIWENDSMHSTFPRNLDGGWDYCFSPNIAMCDLGVTFAMGASYSCDGEYHISILGGRECEFTCG